MSAQVLLKAKQLASVSELKNFKEGGQRPRTGIEVLLHVLKLPLETGL